MKKFYLREENRNEEEKRTGKASYKTIIDRYIKDLVLCNNIASIDDSIWDNIQVGEITENTEIYQYYLCNVSEWEINSLKELTDNNNDVILSYSNVLECDVLMVDHYGTSWDYVLTDVDLTENIEEHNMKEKELKELRKTTIEKLEELKNNLSYDMEDNYYDMINIMIDYDNEAQDRLYLNDMCNELLKIVDDELLKDLLKENCDCRRLYFLVGGIAHADNIYKINAYGNLENVTSDDIIICIDEAIDKLKESIEVQ